MESEEKFWAGKSTEGSAFQLFSPGPQDLESLELMLRENKTVWIEEKKQQLYLMRTKTTTLANTALVKGRRDFALNPPAWQMLPSYA